MGYCFLRIDKIKNAAEFTRKYEHNYRTENVPNAIPELRDQNEELVKLRSASGEPCNYLTAYNEKIKSLEYYRSNEVRKNNVRGLEVFTTFSRESKEQIDIEKWKEENVKWLRSYFNKNPEKYGDNLISVMYHGDECGNVHCHAVVIPVDETGKLSAYKFIGGRAKLREMQDSYAKAMEPLGLERGLKGSSARHQDITKFYAKLNEKMDVPIPEKGESAEEYKDRMLEFIQKERADNLRKVLEMDRDLRRKRDIAHQRDMAAAKGSVLAEAATLEADLQKMQMKLQEQERVMVKNYDEIKRQDQIIAEKKAEIRAINNRARDLQKKMGKLEDIREELRIYRLQQAAMDYARNNDYTLLVEDTERNMDTMLNIYERQLDDRER